ncbi:hypothetical protein AB0D32_03925 [Micromonospora sp. NPDC048170]|uniref:hypothetical protein n=1 Tax=Micromonospora sp. NPDC048170 TaxID=3154819 RepID=UPI0033D5F1FC
MQTRLSAQGLAEKYPDPNFRVALKNLLNLQVLLDGCLIAEKYRVPPELHQPIQLTDDGERAFDTLGRRGVIPYPETRLMCLLALWNIDVLVDPIATDINALVKAIGKDIAEQRIRFPYTLGRSLYDKAAEELEINSIRNGLNSAETQTFLQGTPQGVFQSGPFVTGPYGLLRSKEHRIIDPVRYIWYHCSDVTCESSHRYDLQTSMDAPINELRPKFHKYLERESKEPSDWWGYLKDLGPNSPSVYRDFYNDLSADSLIYTLGDCLVISELRSLFSWLITNTDELSAAIADIPGVSGATAESMNEAQLLQLIAVARNAEIVRGLDSLILQSTIEIPYNEIRRPVMNRRGTGPYGLITEINRYGVRLDSPYFTIGPLRLRRLIAEMYPLDNERERTELDWQMRDELAETTEARIEKFVQNRSPRDVVSSLLLVRHSNLIVATENLMIQDDLLRDDEDRVNSVLWKLGFSISDGLDQYSDFWRYLDATKRACRSAGVNPQMLDIEQIRREAGPFFPELERVLKDCLAFATWALLTDHHGSAKRFVYRPDDDAPSALRRLHEMQAKDEQGRRLSFSADANLYALVRGFGVLADHLDSLMAQEQQFLRDPSEVPKWAEAQKIQIFPFVHTVPFLDLLPESQQGIVDGLRKASQRMASVEVSDVRNSLAHPRTADVVKLGIVLETVEEVVTFFRTAGYMRQQFRPVKTETDEAGNSLTILSDPFGQTVSVHEPSYFDWLDLPAAVAGVHFMAAAYFYEPSRMLRFVTETKSAFSGKWGNYPRRQKERGARAGSVHAEAPAVPGPRRTSAI